MSDIWIKTSNTGTTRWRKATSIHIKRFSGATTKWFAAKVVWIKNTSQGWLRVWPTSGVFPLTDPYITTTASGSTPLYGNNTVGANNVVRIGTTYYGRNGTWDPNGFSISSYNYLWPYYSTSVAADSYDQLGNLGSGVFSSPSNALTISTFANAAAADGNYISFRITANASNSLYSNTADSKDSYGKIRVIRRTPINTTFVLNGTASVGSTLSVGSSWNTTEAYKPDAARNTIYWYKSSSNTSIYNGQGRTQITSANGSYSYVVQPADLGSYIIAEETAFNTGSDYDIGVGLFTNGLNQVTAVSAIVVTGLSAPTSTSISSMSRLNNTTVRAVIDSSGGSGPYYQQFWTTASSAPNPENRYDAASTTSTVTEDYTFNAGSTYYFYIRSSSENLGNTTTNGTGTSGTYSAYGPSTGAASYAFVQASGSPSISGNTTVGSTLTLTTSPSGSPSAQVNSIIWRRADGGAGGNSFTAGSVLQSGGTTYTIDSPVVAYSSVGYAIRAEVVYNNGLGVNAAISSNSLVVTSSNLTAPTISSVTVGNIGGPVSVSFTGGSGPSYQAFWWGTATAPTASVTPDATGSSSPLTDSTGPSSTATQYMYVRSVLTAAETSIGPSTLASPWSSGVGFSMTQPAPTNATAPTLTPTSISVGTLLTAGVGTWNNTPTSYDIRIYRGTAGVLTSETLVASGTSTSLTYTITQADYDSGQRYFRTYVNATNSGGSSGFIAGQERGPIATPVVAPTGGAVSISTNTGNYNVGSIITYSTTGWANTPTSYSLRLYNGTNPVLTSDLLRASTSSTSGTYTIVSGDVPNYFKAFATASNSAGTSTEASSAQVGPAVAVTTVPGIVTSFTATSSLASTTLSWNATWSEPSSNGGATITSYNVFVERGSSSSGPWSAATTSISTTSGGTYSGAYTSLSPYSTVNATTPKTIYGRVTSTTSTWIRVYVAAVNSVGTGSTTTAVG